MLSLMKLDLPAVLTTRLRSVLHYTGDPIDAQTVTDRILIQEGYRVQKTDAIQFPVPRSAGVGGLARGLFAVEHPEDVARDAFLAVIAAFIESFE